MSNGPGRDGLVGRTIDGCRVERLLGSGGMGDVYLGHEEFSDRWVALKTIRPEFVHQDEQATLRFRNEVRACAKIRSNHVVQLFAAGELPDGGHYMRMEYVDGQSLADARRDLGGVVPLETALGWTRQAARGLHDAAAVGIVHRDIKPANLLLAKDGTLRVADFGIAFLADARTRLTQDHSVPGTALYMAPELFEGQPASTQSDVYSLGATLYQLATGRSPTEGSTIGEIYHDKREREALELPDDLTKTPTGRAAAALVRRMTARAPEDRPGSFADVADAIERALAGDDADGEAPTLPSGVTRPTAAAGPARRRGGLAAGLALTALVGCVVAVAVWFAQRDDEQAGGGSGEQVVDGERQDPAPAGPAAPEPGPKPNDEAASDDPKAGEPTAAGGDDEKGDASKQTGDGDAPVGGLAKPTGGAEEPKPDENVAAEKQPDVEGGEQGDGARTEPESAPGEAQVEAAKPADPPPAPKPAHEVWLAGWADAVEPSAAADELLLPRRVTDRARGAEMALVRLADRWHYVDRGEVTWEQWRRLGLARPDAHTRDADGLPARGVDEEQVERFVAEAKAALPTFDEWRELVYGDGREFPWGDEPIRGAFLSYLDPTENRTRTTDDGATLRPADDDLEPCRAPFRMLLSNVRELVREGEKLALVGVGFDQKLFSKRFARDAVRTAPFRGAEDNVGLRCLRALPDEVARSGVRDR